MGFAQSPAVADDLVAGFPRRVRRGLDRAGEIDARDHWKAPHHRRFAGDGEPVLVVHRGVADRDSHVALHQLALVEIGVGGARARVGFVDADGFECGHAVLVCWCKAQNCAADARRQASGSSEPLQPRFAKPGNASSSQYDARCTPPVMKAMPVTTSSTPTTRSTLPKCARKRCMKRIKGAIASAAIMNGMPRPAE